MNVLFSILLPSVVGLNLYYVLVKEKNYFNLGMVFCELCLFSNLFIMVIVKFLNDFNDNLIEYLSSNCYFAVKYIILSIVLNIFLAFLFSILKKGVSLEIGFDEKEKKVKN